MPQATPAWFAPFRPLFDGMRLAALLVFSSLASPVLHAADVQFSGVLYRPLSDVAAAYGFKLATVEQGKTMQLQNSYCTIDFTANERSLVLNGQPMALGAPIINRGGTFYLSTLDFNQNIFPLLSPGQIHGVPALHRIIIDPGHGGDDPGTEVFPPGTRAGTGRAIDNEKTHTLEVGLILADELRRRGYEVVMTRDHDVTFDRHQRPLMANQYKGDLYLSIHFNESEASYVNGVETWIMTPEGQPSTAEKPDASDNKVWPGNRFDYWNTIVGFSVERTVTKELGATDRGVKRRRLDVLVPLNMPGLLVECGFLSNPSERALIDSPAYRQKIAAALADGIDLYKTTLSQLRQGGAAPGPAPVPPLPKSPTAPEHHPEWINEISLTQG